MTSIDSSGPKGMVAQLRERLDEINDAAGDFGLLVRTTDLGTLLTIVERFAGDEPVDAGLRCRFCGWRGEHDPDDCPWLAARKACGMDGDA